MGSVWESLIRTIKSCVYKYIERSKLKYFDLVPLLLNIQNSINSRPLAYMASDKYIEPLTPNSFLKIQSNSRIAFKTSGDDSLWNQATPLHEKVYESFKVNTEKYEHFRTLWNESYLLSLREYCKDLYQSNWVNQDKVGNVVLVKSLTKFRPFWQMGKIKKKKKKKKGGKKRRGKKN
ncbi:UNVERIFIED_CONTAM: hypothetical protein GTU68_059453 [Idotea baltica]|nr:hypothetical protein [Idotea baltica]